MDNCKVNFVHKQQYKVYNHFENLEKQIGYVELNKLYYIARITTCLLICWKLC